MNDYFKLYLKSFSYLLFPKRCYLCGDVIAPHERVCQSCEKVVRRVELPICYRCAVSKKDCVCEKRRNRYITAFASPFYYTDIVKKSIRRLKFKGEKDISKELAKEMARFAKKVYDGVAFDLATFVPMTRRELSQRGYNQGELISKETAKSLGIPCENVLCKLYETHSQRDLKERYRSGNVLGVFEITKVDRIKGKRILLCDDVLTTGATLTECAKMLMIRGAREVICLTAAVGVPHKKENGGRK